MKIILLNINSIAVDALSETVCKFAVDALSETVCKFRQINKNGKTQIAVNFLFRI